MTKDLVSYKTSDFYFSHPFTESPTDIDTHIHDCYELFYFISGDVKYYIEGQVYQLEKNDMIVTNSRELHRIVFNSQKNYERKWIQFKSEFIFPLQTKDYNMLTYIEKRKLGYFNRIRSENVISYGIDKYWLEIEKYCQNDSAESSIMIKTLLVQMLIKINKVFSENKIVIMDSFENNEKINTILDYINENLNKTITLDLLEKLFYVNKYYLSHIFKKSTGFTVIEYITYKRIIEATKLLYKGIPILEISDAVGFGDYSNFYKAFKKITGVSPKQYTKEF